MKIRRNNLKNISVLILVIISINAYSLHPIKPISTLLDVDSGEDTIYVVPNNRYPIPVIGNDSMVTFLNNYTAHYSDGKNKKSRVIVEFIVEKDGTLSHVRTVEGLGINSFEDSIAVQAVSFISEWYPGLQDSIPVRVYSRLPVWFQ